jgi:hypothetical protein
VQRWYVSFSSIHIMHKYNAFLVQVLWKFDKILHSFSFLFSNLSRKDRILKSHKRNKKKCKYVTKFYVLMFSKCCYDNGNLNHFTRSITTTHIHNGML